MKLHRGRSLWIPLSGKPHDAVREDIIARAPSWGEFSIANVGKYLGFFLGPGRGDHPWEAAIQKMIDRANIWRTIGGGSFVSMNA